MSWDEIAVIYRVRGASYKGNEYWKIESHGSLSVSDSTGSNKWLSSPDSNQSYLIQSMDPDSLALLMETLILKSSINALGSD